MNPNININFKSPLVEVLIGIGLHLFFSFASLTFFIAFLTGAIGDFNDGLIILALFNLAMLVFVIYSYYELCKKFISICSDTIYYYRFRKIFQTAPISSTKDLFIATNGKYGDRDKIDKVFRDMVGDNLWIRGFKIDSDGKFIFPHDELNEVSQHEEPEESPSTPDFTEPQQASPLPVSEEITNLSNLHAQGILTDEEFQKAKDRLINRI